MSDAKQQASILDQLNKASSAEDFFTLLGVAYDPKVVSVVRLHILASLDLDGDSFDESCDHLVILRHTLMNPYLIDRHNGISYIDRYFDYLASRIRTLAATTGA